MKIFIVLLITLTLGLLCQATNVDKQMGCSAPAGICVGTQQINADLQTPIVEGQTVGQIVNCRSASLVFGHGYSPLYGQAISTPLRTCQQNSHYFTAICRGG